MEISLRRLPKVLPLLTAALALVATSCSGKPARVEAAERPSTTTSEPTTSTTVAPTTTVPPTTRPAPAGLGIGARGPAVQSLEAKLAELKYDVGRVEQPDAGDSGNGGAGPVGAIDEDVCATTML